MVADRVIGVLCLGVAVAAATWGDGPTGREAPRRGVRTTLVAGTGGEAGPSAAAPSSTSTTSAGAPAGAGAPSTTTAPKASSTTTSTAPPVNREADAAAAQKALLASGDLPAGYTQTRPAPPPGGSEGPFERCLGKEAAVLTAAVRAKAGSAEYVKAEAGTVSSTAAVLDQPTSAERVMAILGSDPARSCFEGLINMRLARNPNLSEDARGTITPLDAGAYADQTTAFRFEVHLPAEDVEAEPPEGEEEIPYVADFVFVRRGRAIALFEFASLRHPFPPADLQTVAGNVAAHL